MILADKITEERKKNGQSQEELANQLGVSRQAVSKWESAGAVPDLQRILQMSELFCVSTDYLLKDEMKAENITYHESTESYAEPLKKVTMENANEFLDMIGVNLLVRVGMVKSSYDTLLQEGEYTKEEKLFKKKTDTFSGVYWCLTTAIYLAWSFWTMSWDITWIVWPVAGVLFAALLGVVKMVLKNGSETQHYI